MNKLLAVLLASTGLIASQAQAALPTVVSTALSDTTADVGTVGGLILVIGVAVAGFVWIKKAMH